MGKIAGILAAKGDLDEALRILREEELPVYEKLGARRDVMTCRWGIAVYLQRRGQPGDEEQADALLQLAHEAAVAMALPEAAQIRGFMKRPPSSPAGDDGSAPGKPHPPRQ